VESSKKKCVLVVANRTASTQRLLDEISRRAEREPTRFTLLIPDAPNRKAADWTLEVAIPLLRRAARGPVDHLVGGPDPFIAVQDAVRGHDFDEIIISTLPRRTSKWLRRDLIHRVESLGLPVTAVIPQRAKIGLDDPEHRAGHRPEWRYSVTYAGAPMAITRANSLRTASTRSVSPHPPLTARAARAALAAPPPRSCR
jgi:hypothetical protein